MNNLFPVTVKLLGVDQHSARFEFELTGDQTKNFEHLEFDFPQLRHLAFELEAVPSSKNNIPIPASLGESPIRNGSVQVAYVEEDLRLIYFTPALNHTISHLAIQRSTCFSLNQKVIDQLIEAISSIEL